MLELDAGRKRLKGPRLAVLGCFSCSLVRLPDLPVGLRKMGIGRTNQEAAFLSAGQIEVTRVGVDVFPRVRAVNVSHEAHGVPHCHFDVITSTP